MTAREDTLLLAVPAHAVCTVRGLRQRIDLAVLEALAADHWFASGRALDGDSGSLTVLGLVLVQRRQPDDALLLTSEGALVQVVAFTAETLAGGAVLADCKAAVRRALAQRSGALAAEQPLAVELVAYAAEPTVLGRAFALIYRATPVVGTPGAGAAVAGANATGRWIPIEEAATHARRALDWFILPLLPPEI